MVKSTTATVLLSGGVDSAACLHFLRAQGAEADALFVDYGQAAAPHESRAASRIASELNVPLQYIRIAGVGHFGAGELIGRNTLLLSIALFLTRGEPKVLALGIHDGTPYYDCSRAFTSSVNAVVAEQTDGRVSVVAPFIDWRKKDVYDYFVSTNLTISLTYSCETGTDPVCGQCASCKDRQALGC